MMEESLGGFPLASWDLYEMVQALIQAPGYHLLFEAALIVWIIRLMFIKSYKPAEKCHLTDKEKKELIEEWQPDPLVPDIDPNHPVLTHFDNRVVNSKLGKHVVINGKRCINVASLNFLGIVGRQDIEEESIKSLRKYGVGSCGPRGFYGTVDVHLELEDKLAKFMNAEEAIVYSYGFATISSAIPAYSKRGDLLFVDEGVHFAIQQGIVASRSQVKYFKHNDMEDLERLLKEQVLEDKKNPKKAKATRRFLLVEGLYMKYADLCPLPKLVELKEKYKVRIFMDETVSFGTIGAHGRGVTEYYDISVGEIDLIAASLENSLGSVGGFCCGKAYVVDHQRLSGLGYCFSASTPPMLSRAAISALALLEENPVMVTQLQENCKYMHGKLSKLQGLSVVGVPISPVLHLQLVEPSGDRSQDSATLQQIVQLAENKGVALTTVPYLDLEHVLPPPSICISVNIELSQEEMDQIVAVIEESTKEACS